MEIISNFSSIHCFISFIIGAVFMLTTFCIAAMGKVKEPRNNIHFYVARDESGNLWLYMCKPIRDKLVFDSCHEKGGRCMGSDSDLRMYGLNENDYKDLKWEDEPVEVFINMED